MKIKLISICLLLFVIGISGCVQETPDSTNMGGVRVPTNQISNTQTNEVTLPNLEISDLDCYTTSDWTYAKGKITNKGIKRADYVVITVDFFNNDKLVDTIETIIDGVQNISSGESYTFSELKKDLPTWTRCEAYTRFSDEVEQAVWRDIPKVRVTNVIDGDTIQLSTGESVRLIGINAPEKGEKCYEESKDFLEYVILNEEITLEKDVEDKDQYGRLLRYVYANGSDVSYGMIYLGYAHKYKYGLNTRESSRYEKAEKLAKENCECIWQPCSNTNENIVNYIKDKCFSVTYFNFNAVGDDNYNLNDEYVTLKNNCDYDINMEGWTIKDDTASHVYSFPAFSITGKNSFTLYTGVGDNTDTNLYWGRTSGDYAAIWNNNGDTLYLRDKKGDLVLSSSYTGFA